MKTYGGVEVQLQVFQISPLHGGEWPASRPGRFIPRERTPGIHWIEPVVKRRWKYVLHWSTRIYQMHSLLSSSSPTPCCSFTADPDLLMDVQHKAVCRKQKKKKKKKFSKIRGPFAKFVDSPNYTESELCGDAVTVSFSKCLPWQAPPTSRKRAADRSSLQNFLTRSSIFMVGKAQESHGGEIWTLTADILMGFHRPTLSKPNTEFNSDLAPCDFWAFPIMKRELRSKKFRNDERSAARFREVGGAL
jgi:hypothetical protein